jgi:hypothetical protein
MPVLILSPDFAGGASTPPPSFTPPTLPDGSANYVMWCEARHLAGLSDNDPVSEFTNQINSNHWTGSGSTRPLFKTNVLNGEPVLRFDGSDDFLQLATDILSGKSGGCVMVVLKVDNDPPGDVAQSGLWNMDGDTLNVVHYPWTNGQIYEAWGSTARKSTGVNTGDLDSWHLYAVASQNSEFRVYIDGVDVYNTSSNTFSSFTHGVIALGRSGSGSGGEVYFDGDIAALIVLDDFPTDNDRNTIADYLAGIYFP